ncbi:PAS domain S-box-containing protein [Zeaxanthinibacter enoshimensis]|uniref:histidine kinase n=2 Tax=Zeaxanthinibacter enoshimensis TaxID=392009 RepID=A0A4R6TM37_9FLAO|nr:PAS domain S-box-containing protein [Zeaxanthinibacter enoshimensis]
MYIYSMRAFEQNDTVFRMLSEAISEGIVVVNEKQDIVATNKRADRLFRYEVGELEGKPLATIIPPKYHGVHREHVKGFYRHNEQKRMAEGRSLYGLRKTGEQFPLEVGLNPFTLPEGNYVLALVYDMTELRDKDSQIMELNAHLEEKIQLRTQELSNTVAELQKEIKRRKKAEALIKTALQREKELNELKTKFLSLVSHEFKTPLSGIMTSATLVGKYKTGEQQEKREKHLQTIFGEVKRLNSILNDFLSIERLDQGKEIYRKTHFSLSKVINEVVYNTNMILKSGQSINLPQNIDEVTLYQDEKILKLSLSNLLYNAAKYSPEDSEIDLEVELDESQIIFSVRDNGIGIPEKDQKHIFDRYFRAENVLLTQGTGIGLNIVRGHLNNLGGSIDFESELNVGSTFTITLPIKE